MIGQMAGLPAAPFMQASSTVKATSTLHFGVLVVNSLNQKMISHLELGVQTLQLRIPATQARVPVGQPALARGQLS